MTTTTYRNDTPGIDATLFFNSAGSSLMTKNTIDVQKKYLDLEASIGGYAAVSPFHEKIASFYVEAAKLIGARPEQIAFCTSATDAYSKALSSIPFSKGDVILTTNNDYISNQLAFVSLQKRFGVVLKRCDDLDEGGLDEVHLLQMIDDEKPVLVAVTHIPTSSGLVQDVKKTGQRCKELGIYFLIDACQTLGQLQFNVQETYCDFLTGTGRKFLRGPRGTGLLYVSDKVLNDGLHPLFTDQGGASWISENDYELLPGAKRFERWEKNYGNVIGLAEALSYANTVGIDTIETRNTSLHNLLRAGIADNKKILCHDTGKRLSSIVTVAEKDGGIEMIVKQLTSHNVTFSISGINSAFIDFSKKGIKEVVRFSPHYFNTEEEVNTLLRILQDV